METNTVGVCFIVGAGAGVLLNMFLRLNSSDATTLIIVTTLVGIGLGMFLSRPKQKKRSQKK